MPNPPSTDVRSSLHLGYEKLFFSNEYKITPRWERLGCNTYLWSFCCVSGARAESKPEKERERGRTAPAFGTKPARGITSVVAPIPRCWLGWPGNGCCAPGAGAGESVFRLDVGTGGGGGGGGGGGTVTGAAMGVTRIRFAGTSLGGSSEK